MELGVPELLIILVIVIVLFGGGRVAKLGGELGRGLREFRQGLAGDESHSDNSGVAQSSKSSLK
jgi:sec-independent protein translocase protein TatA